MSDERNDASDEQPSTESTGMVRQRHGGKLHRGGNARPTEPTPNDVRVLCRKRYYQVIPALSRIARNQSMRPAKGAKPKRTFRVSDQIAAARTLAQYGMDQNISAADVREFLRGIDEDIRRFLPKEQADALLSMIAPRAMKL
jgi:hypothetical protein